MKYLSSISSDNCDVTFVDGTFTGDLTVDTNTLYVDSTNNRVGIGTSSPGAKLHVNGDVIRVVSSTYAGVESHNTNGTWESYIGTESGGGGNRYNSASSTHTFYNNSSAVMRINSSGDVGIGTTSPSDKLHVSGGNMFLDNGYGLRWGDNSVGIYGNASNETISMYTSSSERARITSGGNVLIGTTTDSGYKLQVSGDVEVSDSQADVLIKSTTAGQASRLVLNTTTREWRIGTHSGQNNSLWIYDATAASYRLALDTSGNLGVGTTSPAYKLDVTGELRATSVLRANSNAIVGGYIDLTGDFFHRDDIKVLNKAANNWLTWAQRDTAASEVVVNLNYIGTITPGSDSAYDIGTNTVRFANGYFDTLYGDGSNLTGITETDTLDSVTGRGATTTNSITVGGLTVDTSTLHVDAANNRVGIGTTSPARTLHVKKTGDNEVARFESDQTTSYIELEDANTTGQILIGTQGDNFKIHTAGSERIRVTGGGNVLIGTTTDNGYKLAVSGSDAQINGVNVGKGGGSVAQNTIVGYGALTSTTTGNYNTALGYQAGYGNTTGERNTAVGRQALRANSTGSYNVALGMNALDSNTASNNTALGYQAAYSNTSGNIVAIGWQAGFANTTGSITAIGYQALKANTTGSENVAVGRESMRLATASNNTAVGTYSGYVLTTGSGNTMVGRRSLFTATTANYNTALGYQALKNNATSSSNTAVGLNSLVNTTGNSNTAIGTYAGDANTTGSNNIFIGNDSDGVSVTDSNRTFIGNSSTTSTWVGGNLLVGTTTDSGATVHIRQSSSGQSPINSPSLFIENNGSSNSYYALQVATQGGGYSLNVTNAGRVGIGTTSPSSLLQVQSGVGNTQLDGHQILLSRAGNNHIFATSASGVLALGTNNAEKMRITSGGNVSIGTTQNFGRLMVSGASTTPSLSSLNGTDISLILSNSDTGYGTMFATFGSGIGALQQRRTNSATYYSFSLQPHGGNVLIGTTTDSGQKLQVNGSVLASDYIGSTHIYLSSPDSWIFRSTGGTERMRLTSAGSLGIGTTSPSEKLDVAGNIQASGSRFIRAEYDSNHYMQLESNSSGGILKGLDGGTTTVLVRSYGDSYFNGGSFGIGQSSPTARLEVIGTIKQKTGSGYANYVQQSVSEAQITFSTYSNNQTNHPSAIKFSPNGTEAVRIDNDGNLGVGTSSPDTLLHLESTSSGSSPILTVENDNDIKLKLGAVRSLAGTAPDTTFIAYDSSLRFIADADSTTEVARISSGGNLLIGTTTDNTQKLQVNGTSRFDDTMYVSEYIAHLGDGNTAVRFLDDALQFNAGGVAMMKLTEGSADVVTVNPDSADVNFQVHGDTVANLLFVDAGTSRVGIGTSSPDEKLSVYTDSTSGLELVGQTASNQNSNSSKAIFNGYDQSNGPFIQAINTSAYGVKRLGFFVNRTASDYTTLPTESVSITNTGNVGIGTTSPTQKLQVSSGDIMIDSGNAIHLTTTADHTKVQRSNNGLELFAGSSARVHVNDNGNVGIGTTSPSQKFHVVGNVRIDDGYTLGWGADTTKIAGNSSANTLAFKTSSANRLYINSSGNVGINTTSPSSKLHVVGDFFLKGSDTSSSTKNFQVQTGNGTSIMDFRNDAYAFFGCGQGGGSASGFIFRYNSTFGVQFTGYNYGNGTSPSYKPILMDTDLAGRSQGVYVNYGITGYTAPAPTTTAEFAVRGRGTSSSFTAKFEDSSTNPLLYIKDNGNVMIGTGTDSGYKLDVEGNTNTNGDYYVNGNQGWSGTININTNPPVAITVEGGIITNVT